MNPSAAGRLVYRALGRFSNHDGEDSDNWEAFYYPLGNAHRAPLAFADLLEGRVPSCAEKWDADLVG
jgi:guanylate kinase